MKINGKLLFALLLLGLFGGDVFSQEQNKDQFPLSGRFGTRFMSTINDGTLTDYSVMISSLNVKFEYDISKWLSFKTTGVGLLNYGTDNLLVQDPSTGSGPMFEANLWHPRNMTGRSEFSLPELSLTFKFKSQTLEVGRFVKDTPLIKGEKWAFPTAMQGLWYNLKASKKWQFQAGLINQISSRFIGEFQKLGNSLGRANNGIGLDGSTSRYINATTSDYLGIVNASWTKEGQFKINVWDYFLENISNTLLVESDIVLSEEIGLTLSALMIFQSRVGDGGNSNPDLRYFVSKNSSSFGLRLNKRINKNTLSLNFNRITGAGRMLIPREWGVEPFYTMQRRTRTEGTGDVTSVNVRYQRTIVKEYGSFKINSSLASHNLANPISSFENNKYEQPSNINLDFALKFSPVKRLKGASLELFVIHRFLNQDIENELKYVINRADFTHFDLIFNYSF